MAGEYWMSDAAWAAIAPLLPKNRPGARRVDDRRVISGILHVLRSGCRWNDCPAVYGPPTTIDNRWNRWSRRGLWVRLFEAVAATGPADVAMIDSSALKAHRASAGGKGGRQRNAIERMFCQLKDWRRIATGYDRLAHNYALAVALVAAVTQWTD